MNIFLLAVLLPAACEAQSTTKQRSVTARSSYFIDEAVREEVKILKEQLIRTNTKLEELEKTCQPQHGRFLYTLAA